MAFTADHGESFGEGGFYLTHGHATTPDQVRVPLLMRAPELAPGRRADPVHHVDLAPTLVELAGLEAFPEARGLVLGPYLRSGRPLPERLLFSDVGSARERVRGRPFPARPALGPGPAVRVSAVPRRRRGSLGADPIAAGRSSPARRLPLET